MLSLVNISLAYGGPPLLDAASMEVLPGERIALIGRNGSGKSSLLKLISGEIQPDAGERIVLNNARIATLPQVIPVFEGKSIGEVLRFGLLELHLEDWEVEARLDRGLSALSLPEEATYSTLSSGQKRQVLLLAALLVEPDLLLLDEPTNHLDVETIQWMEDTLLKFKGALLFISHDRSFIKRLSTSILDLDRGKLTRWNCDYSSYLLRKEEALEAEDRQNQVFDKKLAQEEAWIRQGIKARRTRNEGRVRHLLKMRDEHRQRRNRTDNVRMDVTGSQQQSGRKVIVAEEISAHYEGAEVFNHFSCEIMRGDRVGILGPNGCGKTTLIRMLLGKLPPESGSVTLGTNLQVAYFDQNRDQLDDSQTVADNVSDGNEFVEVAGKKKHVISHLKDFLFTSEEANMPISNLSGGERNRLLLAKLFTRPFNVLVMDEPTNDLDLETLELLEDQLDQYTGTLILASHDRAFIDNVVTELYVFEPDQSIRQIIGGYTDYSTFLERTRKPEPVSKTTQASAKKGKPAKPRRFLNREQRELDSLPHEIETLENEQEQLANDLSNPEKLKADPQFPVTAQQRLDEIESSLSTMYDRWEKLETLKKELE
ncbi:MAG: ATP-binding cassette domain-containing protein [Puniceicoccaceae bacterium]